MMKCCGVCKWWTYEEIDQGYICVNADSRHCADWTEKDDNCEKWEGNNENIYIRTDK